MDTNGNSKELLIKDLCSRLPYELWVQYDGKEYLATGYGHGRILLLPSVFSSINGPCQLIEEVKPYLRPMSSMTQKEEEDLKQIIEIELNYLASGHVGHNVESAASSTFEIDFYNSHHFDFRGLIPMGLALEAPKDMYKIE